MRFLVPLISGLVFVFSTWAFEQHDLHHVVKKAVEEARSYYSKLEFSHSQIGTRSHKSTAETLQMDVHFAVHRHVVQILINEYNKSEEVAHRHVRQATSNMAGCTIPQTVSNCPADKFARYRTLDGTCNNPNNPDLGAAMTRLRRILVPDYFNGDEPRGGLTSRLINARTLSAQLHPDRNFLFPAFTNMVHQFGQFLDHDLSLTPEAGRKCCLQGGIECWSISDSTKVFARTCLDFTRSTPCLGADGRRQQTNMNTAFIDGSQIYGSTSQRSLELRALVNGTLLVAKTAAAPNVQLPGSTQTTALRANQVRGQFISGDDRINEMPGLAVMHNLFLLEHNRIAQILRAANPNAPETAIFNEARRIVGAEMQAIVYNEYLPMILDPSTMREFNLYSPAASACISFNPNVDPSITNEFATAAYRFGHTLVSNIVSMLNPSTRTFVEQYPISEQYFQSEKVLKSNGRGFHEILTGLADTNCQDFDPFVVTGLTEHLFKNRTTETFGSDLIARNIQRGRDHGLRSYNEYRRWFGLPILDFNSPPGDWLVEDWTRLRKVYLDNRNTAEDLDLFTGGIYELPLGGGASGVLFQKIKGDQFARLKFGDRLFFLNCGVFTTEQRAFFLKLRLSDIICANSQGVRTTERANVFVNTGGFIPCNDPSRLFNTQLFTSFPCCMCCPNEVYSGSDKVPAVSQRPITARLFKLIWSNEGPNLDVQSFTGSTGATFCELKISRPPDIRKNVPISSALVVQHGFKRKN